MKKRLIASVVALLAAIAAIVAFNGSANAGSTGAFRVGQTLVGSFVTETVASVSADRHSAKTAKGNCYTDVLSKGTNATTVGPMRISGTNTLVYRCPSVGGVKGW